ncbi:TPA: hypothetical protein N0F65_005830 [Lagenidium giganteum]|uniref:Uncharacterized protein n=1 Tax=Lagenidium giganteum TaxID=4803 RepID=A0AAV2YGV4_9STRA|nr:TPA: hypothetical protein N0F65_005830 [Lagenidium giganteum]
MQPTSRQEQNAMAEFPYREVVGSMMYLMVETWPDLAFYVSEVSRFLANPGKEHCQAVVRGLIYSRGTTEYGLTSKSVTPKNLETSSSPTWNQTTPIAQTHDRLLVATSQCSMEVQYPG